MILISHTNKVNSFVGFVKNICTSIQLRVTLGLLIELNIKFFGGISLCIFEIRPLIEHHSRYYH